MAPYTLFNLLYHTPAEMAGTNNIIIIAIMALEVTNIENKYLQYYIKNLMDNLE